MWKIFNFLKRNRTHAEHNWGSWAAYLANGQGPKWLKNNYKTLASEGFIKNYVAFRAITSTAWSASSVPYFVRVAGKEVDPKNPIARQIENPGPLMGYQDFIYELVMHRRISGNGYVLMTKTAGGMFELKVLRPDRVRIRTNSGGFPIGYTYTVAGHSEDFPIDPINMTSEILHIKDPNPIDDAYGLSPIRAANLGISQHNEASLWNQKLLENSANPTGIMVLKETGSGSVPPSTETIKKIAEDFNSKYVGPNAAGKMPFLSFDMDFKKMGMSPKDMDWINGRNTSAREIALALGYPPHLLGMAEGSTFNNVSEAKLSFYQETVIPVTESTLSGINRHLSNELKKDIEIVPDWDKVDALAPLREKILEQTRKDYEAGGITLNEFRAVRGYDPVPNGDEVFVPAGKLPLNFDPGDMDDESFSAWLQNEGMSKEKAKEIVRLSSREIN